jgi:glutathione S-transferase
LPEAAAICLHLVDKHPGAGLAPAIGSEDRAHFYRWLVFLTNTLQPQIITRSYPERLADDEAGAAAVKRNVVTQIAATLDIIEAHLAARGPWILGDRYSAVEPFLFMLCRWTRNDPSPARARPHIKKLLDAMMQRPAVRHAHEQEGISAPFY